MTQHILPNARQVDRQLAKLLRDVLAREAFSDATSLREAFEARARHLGLFVTRARANRALDLVGSNTELLALLVQRHRRNIGMVAHATAAPQISAGEAKTILERFGIDVRGGRLQRASLGDSRLVPM